MERALKKRMYIYTGVLLVSIIAAVAVITIYYEYRLRYMVTSLYGQDSQAGKQLLYILFYGTHGNIPVSDYPKVLHLFIVSVIITPTINAITGKK